VADAEVDAPVRPIVPRLALAAAFLLVLGLAFAPATAVGPSPAPRLPFASAASNVTIPPVTGNVSGPALVATSSNATFYLNLTGGPAVLDGSFEGKINWTTNVTAANTTGVTVTPDNGSITNATAQPVHLTVATGSIVETVTLVVHATSTLGTANKTANFTTTFRIVLPYTVHATLVAGPEATVLPFNVSVALDGKLVGSVTVPKLKPNATWAFTFHYPAVAISSGYHTFTLTIEDAHGLVTFGDGRTVESTTFYVAAAAPNYSIWYVAGTVAFFGVLFIYATRGAARRRTAGKR
jgi:hypothetical protein